MSRRRVEQYKQPPMPTSIRVDLRMKSGDENRVRGKRVMRAMLICEGDEGYHPTNTDPVYYPEKGRCTPHFYLEFVDIGMRYHRAGVATPKLQAYTWEQLKGYIPQLRAIETKNKTVFNFLKEYGFEVEEPSKETVSLHATVDVSLLRLLEEETDRRNAMNSNPDKRVYVGTVVSDILCQYFEGNNSSPKSLKDEVKEAVKEAMAEYLKK